MCCNNSNCAPQAQLFQESISGNFLGTGTIVTVWSADAGQYSQGTFSLFNSASSATGATGTINGTEIIVADPGTTVSQSVSTPTSFAITAATGDNGTYCITLYKRVLA
ncbi:S-Ena type endospore appendage [Sutcliffiella deserti]|uniref:S-Ena type endospore appendage n=1 Tax=Sutcliffiella deserti TaxID=2875501 RepID=UPI001CC0F796|nr:S-Ena type endospore appendage [Sutcliffiella deserti]